MFLINPHRSEALIEQLVILWERSVRASHSFLTNKDIDDLIYFVKVGVSSIKTLAVKYSANVPVAFMGIDEDKIEMLFVLPEYFGKGIGKELVRYALENHNVKYVYVNEQNPEAVGFYKHLGFKIFERTHFDEQGNPFPILKMRQNNTILINDSKRIIVNLEHKLLRRHFSIREALPGDVTEIIELFKNTVLSINLRHYSLAQVEDWASCWDNQRRIEDILKTHYFIVAVDNHSQIVGFSSITSSGYLDHMFVHKDFQNMGIATLLLDRIERYAIDNSIAEITSEVSITARTFFEKRGYKIVKKQCRQANKLNLINYKMIKTYITMETNFCQSCGMPLTTPEYFGTNADGSVNQEYCIYCYKDGAYVQDCTMDEMIDHCIKYLDEFNGACNTHYTKDEAIAEMRKFFPTLKRWNLK